MRRLKNVGLAIVILAGIKACMTLQMKSEIDEINANSDKGSQILQPINVKVQRPIYEWIIHTNWERDYDPDNDLPDSLSFSEDNKVTIYSHLDGKKQGTYSVGFGFIEISVKSKFILKLKPAISELTSSDGTVYYKN